MTQVQHVQVAILGTGFAGLGMAIRLRQRGAHEFVVFERAGEVGGTWRDNTYPGCACDIRSDLYSFSFAPNPDWAHRYARQPEILAYLKRTAEQYGVTPHIRFNHEVQEARWDDEAARWRVQTSQGEYSARVLVSGHGPLIDPKWPEIPGLESFRGERFHSARWNHSAGLRGKRVAVIGRVGHPVRARGAEGGRAGHGFPADPALGDAAPGSGHQRTQAAGLPAISTAATPVAPVRLRARGASAPGVFQQAGG